MKLWYKWLITTILIWIAFFVSISFILYPHLPQFYLVMINAFGFICWLGTTFIFKKMVIDRLLRLQKQTLPEKLHSLSFKPNTQNDSQDEISKISSQMQLLNRELLALEEKLTQRWNASSISFSMEESESSSDKERISKLAHYDNLTTLPNRIFFNEMLNKSLQHAARQNKKLAILFIDLDRFRNINEALGYKAGDQILKEVANRYASLLRSGDIIARLGGDEFVILLNDINNPKTASSIADKILQASLTPINAGNQDFYVNASIGICIFPEDGRSLEALQKNADIALYKAKCAGGGIYHYFSTERTLEANKHIQLDKALRKAIANNEFVLHYQPKLNLHTGMVTSVEALIRWNSPDLGFINPSQFIPAAEEIGLIMEIGEWALQEACRACKSWQDQGFAPISVAVNISPKQFRDVELVNTIQNALQENQLNPALLELEITESSIIEDVNLTAEKLHTLKEQGVKICIDDFGTGYTSINFLRKFPIDVLKIDQTYLKGVPYNANDCAIISAIIALGHNLGIEVVAEGVETIEQLDYLTEHKCDIIQGYYFSRPLPEPKLLLQLKKRK